MFRRYLDWLVARELLALVSDEGGKETARITAKGRDAYRAMIEWIRKSSEIRTNGTDGG